MSSQTNNHPIGKSAPRKEGRKKVTGQALYIDDLAFPDMLNERFDTFSHIIEYGDAEPTKPQLDVFQMLSSQLDEQLGKWAQLKNDDVPKVGELVKQANLPALIITEKKTD